jgi:hypothetical protein
MTKVEISAIQSLLEKAISPSALGKPVVVGEWVDERDGTHVLFVQQQRQGQYLPAFHHHETEVVSAQVVVVVDGKVYYQVFGGQEKFDLHYLKKYILGVAGKGFRDQPIAILINRNMTNPPEDSRGYTFLRNDSNCMWDYVFWLDYEHEGPPGVVVCPILGKL